MAKNEIFFENLHPELSTIILQDIEDSEELLKVFTSEETLLYYIEDAERYEEVLSKLQYFQKKIKNYSNLEHKYKSNCITLSEDLFQAEIDFEFAFCINVSKKSKIEEAKNLIKNADVAQNNDDEYFFEIYNYHKEIYETLKEKLHKFVEITYKKKINKMIKVKENFIFLILK